MAKKSINRCYLFLSKDDHKTAENVDEIQEQIHTVPV